MPSHYDGSFGHAGLAPSDEEDAIFFTMIYRFRVGKSKNNRVTDKESEDLQKLWQPLKLKMVEP